MNEDVFEAIRQGFPRYCMVRETSWPGAAFVYGLACLSGPGRIAEIGCCNGVTGSYLIRSILESKRGFYVGYELDASSAHEAQMKYEAIWPNGNWKLVVGDFFQTCEPEPVDFVFLDIDPKTNYAAAMDRIVLAPRALVVAHDLLYDPHNVGAMIPYFEQRGFKTMSFNYERGFLVAEAP